MEYYIMIWCVDCTYDSLDWYGFSLLCESITTQILIYLKCQIKNTRPHNRQIRLCCDFNDFNKISETCCWKKYL